ncbi:WSC-domain-containing protein [Metschnikowia bicuspidata var. bicuspidata NRRL YB-4993]|uniref:WSC-domain-containing protein n=1 Tax=Metschnikowia bicuspidata var. bicuspidata NRRL YB-4993 TaxID=869754 RepID=A0A1A0HK94_9ASCO|nr:WSC-domain-containing protein [Metschnikowia bicuspidata var. bicuspidata NRRL YB-4993]OBA24223.1 WSC-domain-containing protein [Metschnikowia bicuspidata var. bicuspidata NRRL YB-4993]
MYTPSKLLLLLLAVLVQADSFSDYGCYSESDILSLLTLQGSYTYQTPSYCEQLCEGEKVAAVMDGKYCYCGLTVPASSLEVDSSKCDVACQGYGSITCGGDGYFEVYVNDDVDGSTMSVSSSSSSTKSSSKSSSKSTSSSTKTSSSSSSSSQSLGSASSQPGNSAGSLGATQAASNTQTSSSASQASGFTTIVSTVTSSPSGTSGSIVAVTTTVASGNSSSSSSSSSETTKSLGVLGGQIAGAVVGSIGGVAVVSLIVFFVLRWRKNRDEDDDDDDFVFSDNKRAQLGEFDSVTPHTFVGGGAAAAAGTHTHNNSNTDRSYSSNNEDAFYFANDAERDNYYANNTEYGRRRLSNGSLPDMLTRNPGSLQVVNN